MARNSTCHLLTVTGVVRGLGSLHAWRNEVRTCDPDLRRRLPGTVAANADRPAPPPPLSHGAGRNLRGLAVGRCARGRPRRSARPVALARTPAAGVAGQPLRPPRGGRRSLRNQAGRDSRGRTDAYDEACHKSHSSAVRRARRLGLRVRQAAGADDWRTYYSIYSAALQRWGSDATSRYGAELFELLRLGEGVELWVVEHPNGTVISGAICLYAQRHVTVWHMSTLAEHYQSRPTSLLEADLIADARQRGLAWYDMCPSGGHRGVAEFKEHLGGQPLECPMVTTETLPAKVIGAMRRVGAGAARAAAPADDTTKR